MHEDFTIYKILSKFRDSKIRVQESIILGYGFCTPTLMKNDSEGTLSFSKIIDIEDFLSLWLDFETNELEIITSTSVHQTKLILEALHLIEEKCIIRKVLEGAQFKLKAAWSVKSGYSIIQTGKLSGNIITVSIRSDLELIRQVIDNYMKSKNLRVKYIETVFLIINNQRMLLGVENWKFSECESLKRFHNVTKLKFLSPGPKIVLSPKDLKVPRVYSPVFKNSSKEKIIKTDQINDRIKEIMKKNSSVKHINYKYWKRLVESGSALLPNEELFAKILSKHKEDLKQKDYANEVKKLAMKMTINLDSNRNKRHIQEVIKHGIINSWLIKPDLMLPKLEKKKVNKKKINEGIFNEKFNLAIEKLDEMKTKIPNSPR